MKKRPPTAALIDKAKIGKFVTTSRFREGHASKAAQGEGVGLSERPYFISLFQSILRGDGSGIMLGDFFFRLQPEIHLRTFLAALLPELVSALPNFLFVAGHRSFPVSTLNAQPIRRNVARSVNCPCVLPHLRQPAGDDQPIAACMTDLALADGP
jgi:hypothetical protein